MQSTRMSLAIVASVTTSSMEFPYAALDVMLIDHKDVVANCRHFVKVTRHREGLFHMLLCTGDPTFDMASCSAGKKTMSIVWEDSDPAFLIFVLIIIGTKVMLRMHKLPWAEEGTKHCSRCGAHASTEHRCRIQGPVYRRPMNIPQSVTK